MMCWNCKHEKALHYATHFRFGVNQSLAGKEPEEYLSPGGCMWAEDWDVWDADHRAGNPRERDWCRCKKFVDNLSYIEQEAKKRNLI